MIYLNKTEFVNRLSTFKMTFETKKENVFVLFNRKTFMTNDFIFFKVVGDKCSVCVDEDTLASCKNIHITNEEGTIDLNTKIKKNNFIQKFKDENEMNKEYFIRSFFKYINSSYEPKDGENTTRLEKVNNKFVFKEDLFIPNGMNNTGNLTIKEFQKVYQLFKKRSGLSYIPDKFSELFKVFAYIAKENNKLVLVNIKDYSDIKNICLRVNIARINHEESLVATDDSVINYMESTIKRNVENAQNNMSLYRYVFEEMEAYNSLRNSIDKIDE